LTSTPLVSVIIPIYNGQEYLDTTIESVATQTYSNWELILVNDGSSDDSSSIIDKYAQSDIRIVGISLDKSSGGPAHPRNIGIDNAKGEYLAFLDADDIWARDKLKYQVEFIEKEELDFMGCSAQYIDSIGKPGINFKRSRFSRIMNRAFGSTFALLASNPLILSSCLLKNGSGVRFREDIAFQSIEDWAFWIDLSMHGKKYEILEQQLVFYRVHENAISNINGEKQYRKGFCLYSTLYMEGAIELPMFIVLFGLQIIRLLKFRILGRHSNV
jgi:teichuronic acid biosynthesis glycosyltransferase TuaG